jgi:uncharacterized PurR-regulated membrane protein YhhQ (DUF165 family)
MNFIKGWLAKLILGPWVSNIIAVALVSLSAFLIGNGFDPETVKSLTDVLQKFAVEAIGIIVVLLGSVKASKIREVEAKRAGVKETIQAMQLEDRQS